MKCLILCKWVYLAKQIQMNLNILQIKADIIRMLLRCTNEVIKTRKKSVCKVNIFRVVQLEFNVCQWVSLPATKIRSNHPKPKKKERREMKKKKKTCRKFTVGEQICNVFFYSVESVTFFNDFFRSKRRTMYFIHCLKWS